MLPTDRLLASVHASLSLETINDPGDLIRGTATIFVDDEAGSNCEVGTMAVYILDILHCADPIDVLDEESEDLLRKGSAVIDASTGEWYEDLEPGLFPREVDYLLLLDHLKLDDAYRGHGIGLAAVKMVIRTLLATHGRGLLLLFPAPLRDEQEIPSDEYDHAQRRLQQHWSNGLGVAPVRPGSQVYGLNLDLSDLGDPTLEPYYAVRCPIHGTISITDEQYDAQMNTPDEPWKCPTCGSVAEWDGDGEEDDWDPFQEEEINP